MASEPVPFIDGHNDVLLALHLAGKGAAPFRARRSEGHLDLERAREGGFERAREGSFAAGFFAVFVLPETDEERTATKLPDRRPPYAQPLPRLVPTAYAAREAAAIVGLLGELTAGQQVSLARTTSEVEDALAGGPPAVILHFEGAEPIEPGLDNLGELYDRGLRSLGLVWSRPNAFAEGVAFRFPSSPDTGAGLTEAGKRLVSECNGLGVMVDVAT
jgi:membrane dipeptidase